MNNLEFIEKMKDKVKSNEELSQFEMLVFIEIVASTLRRIDDLESKISTNYNM